MEKNLLKDKYFLLLLAILILGFIIRITAAHNLDVYADDMHYAPHAINILEAKILQTFDHPPLWYYLTDMSYKIFGVTQLGSRFVGVLFGSLTILLVYLISLFFFSKKVSLIPSFLVAISPMLIHTGSLAEMEIVMIFFVLFSQYLFLKFLQNNKKIFIILSAILLSLGFLSKYIAITFLPSFLVIYYFFNKKPGNQKVLFTKKPFKLLLIFVLILFISFIPILTYNYLLYKDKGYLDAQFSRFLGKSTEVYSGLAGMEDKFDFRTITGLDGTYPGFLRGWSFYFRLQLLLTILALIALPITFLRDRKLFYFAFSSFIFTFIFVAEAAVMEKHFAFAIPYFALLVTSLLILIKRKLKTNLVIYAILLILLIGSSMKVYEMNIFDEAPVGQVINYKLENMPSDSFIIVDSRIYRGQIVWMFNDLNYVEAMEAINILTNPDVFSGRVVDVETYFLECNILDCGWGTIKEGDVLDESMKSFFPQLKTNAKKIETFYEDDKPHFTLYKTNLQLKEDMLIFTKSRHFWFYNPVKYENMENFIFNYETTTFFDKSLDKIAHIILYLAIFLALLSIVLFFYFFTNSFKND